MFKVLILDGRISQGNRNVKREQKNAILFSHFLSTFTQGVLLRLLIRSQQTYAYKSKLDKIHLHKNIFALLENNFKASNVASLNKHFSQQKRKVAKIIVPDCRPKKMGQNCVHMVYECPVLAVQRTNVFFWKPWPAFVHLLTTFARTNWITLSKDLHFIILSDAQNHQTNGLFTCASYQKYFGTFLR